MAAVGVEAQIYRALTQRLGGLTLSPTLPIAYPDVDFTQPQDGSGKPLPYLEIAFLPVPTQAIGISHDGFNSYSGNLQVTVCYPMNSGLLKSQQVAAAIISWFKRGTQMVEGATRVRVIQPPYASQSLQDAPFTRTPVSIRYQAFARQV